MYQFLRSHPTFILWRYDDPSSGAIGGFDGGSSLAFFRGGASWLLGAGGEQEDSGAYGHLPHGSCAGRVAMMVSHRN
jgi:hypothetical protein